MQRLELDGINCNAVRWKFNFANRFVCLQQIPGIKDGEPAREICRVTGCNSVLQYPEPKVVCVG